MVTYDWSRGAAVGCSQGRESLDLVNLSSILPASAAAKERHAACRPCGTDDEFRNADFPGACAAGLQPVVATRLTFQHRPIAPNGPSAACISSAISCDRSAS
jgi:hypothetical protein